MKYRQNEWDGEFETYDEWARFGPQPPYRSATFLDAQGRRCISQQDFARAREDGAFPVRYYWTTPVARKRGLVGLARLGQPDGISPSRMAEMLEVDKAGPKVRC